MKRRLDLRSGTPVWRAYEWPRVRTSRLKKDILTDVLVVGMGVSGAMVAESLASDGLSVTVVDRRGAIKGSTAATTALVSFEIDQPLSMLAARLGRSNAERAWTRSRLAIDSLRARIADLSIECDLNERPSLYLSGSVLDNEGLKAEVGARRSAGLWGRFLKSSELRHDYGIEAKGAILSRGNLALHPGKLCAGLLRAAISKRVRLYAPVEVTGLRRSGRRTHVATRQGPIIDAAVVVLATGYELLDEAPSKGHRIISTWAIATKRGQRAWKDDALIWESSDPYLYLRSTPDGRIICGGEDEDFSDEEARDALIASKSKNLARKLAKLVPDIDPTPEFCWTGSFGTTASGLPMIGRLPRRGPVYAVMGFGGNGITYSQIASEILRAELNGQSDSDARLFGAALPR